MQVVARVMRWGRHYRLGVKEIDLQHEQIVDLLNGLNEAFQTGAERSSLSTMLEELVAAVGAHCQAEERLMERHAYPEFDLHRAEHDFLVGEASRFQREFQAGKAELSESMMTYVADWLRNHIIVSDKRLGEFLRTKTAR